MKLTNRIAIATLALCVGYTEAGLVDFYFEVGLIPKAIAFAFGCACGVVMILGVLLDSNPIADQLPENEDEFWRRRLAELKEEKEVLRQERDEARANQENK